MSTPDPSTVPTNLERQRKQARDLLRAAQAGDAAALARLRAVRSDAGSPSRTLRLADAQLAIAREAGFASWPKLVEALRARDLEAFRDAVRARDHARTRKLLGLSHVRARINDPLFDFGARAAHVAARDEALLSVLIDAGADVNLTSAWESGPFTVLDHADDRTARFLLEQGASLTPNAAARLGWIDELRALLDANPALVRHRGGDGRQPLHEAATPEIAGLLLDRGAGIDTRCIDHHSTPAQYALVERPEVCRYLLARGAAADIFMAARLGNADLAARLLDADPACLDARIGEPGYPPVPPMHIYGWTLGFGRSPQEVGLAAGHHEVARLLAARSPLRLRFLNALLAADEASARELLAQDPSVPASLTRSDHGRLAVAIFHENFAAARLMLGFGFDPGAPGVDGGTALHAACWVGNVGMVEEVLARKVVPVDARDPTHGSTPLGWAAFGAVHRRAPGADYAGVIERLVAAGADVTAPGNGEGRTLMQMAHGNPQVQEALRRHGAV